MRKEPGRGCAQETSGARPTPGKRLTNTCLLPPVAAGSDSHGMQPQGRSWVSGPSCLTRWGGTETITLS